MAKFNKYIPLAGVLLAGVSLASLGSAAMAGDGLYLSGSIGSTKLGHNITRNTGDRDDPSISSLTNETDVSLRLGAGYKTHVTEDFFLSAEAFYNWENVQSKNLNNQLVSQIDLDASFGLDARFGYDVTDKFAVYGLAGVTWLDFENDTSYTFAPPTQDLSVTEAGFTYGVGVEIGLTEQVSLIGEYRITNDVSFVPNADRVGNFVNNNQLDHNNLRLGVNYSF